MKKLFISLLVAIGIIGTFSASAMALTIDASACVLIDASTGRVLYENNAHQALPPASTTKVLTALLVLESIEDLSTTVTLPDDFVNVGESGIQLEPGETQTVEDLLYALMLRSANDAAQALAIAVSGTEEAFVKYMNDKTEELGLKDSTWANPHGLDAQTQLTSAYDLAMITREAIKYPVFNQIIVTDMWTLPWASNVYDHVIYNHNQFLTLYEGADGVKTGYTDTAGNCLVASATRDGMRLIGVVLNCPNQTHYEQMELLMDYGFETYKPLKLASAGDVVAQIDIRKGDKGSVDAVLANDIVISLPSNSTYQPVAKIDLPASLEAPLDAEESIGSVSYSDEMGNTIEVPVYLQESVKRYTFADAIKSVWQSFINAFF